MKFVGFDASEKLVGALKDGDIDGLVVQNPFNMGYLAVKTMADHLRGKKVEKRIDTGARLVDQGEPRRPGGEGDHAARPQEVARGVRRDRARRVLALAGIEKSFGPVVVLRGVDLEVPTRTRCTRVLGENGAGKSTLMRILLGVEHADRGHDDARRQAVRAARPGRRAARRRRDGAAGADALPAPRRRREHRARHRAGGRCSASRARARRARVAERSLALVAGRGRIPLDARAGALERRRPAARRDRARAGAGRRRGARVLVLDEPTASLGKADADRLFERVKALAESGLAILLVTHFLADVRAHADRYTVLRDGKVQGAGDPREVAPETDRPRDARPRARVGARRGGRREGGAGTSAEARERRGDAARGPRPRAAPRSRARRRSC